MKLSLPAPVLSTALATAMKHGMYSTPHNELLSQVELRATEDTLTVSGTDFDRRLSIALPATVEQAGVIHVSVKDMIAALKTPTGEVALHLEETPTGARTLVVETGGAAVRLREFAFKKDEDASAWAFRTLKAPTTFEIAGRQLSQDLARVEGSQSKEQTRYYLNGVFLELHEGELSMTATDGKRLATVARPTPAGAESLTSSIIPRDFVATLLALAGDEPVRIQMDRLHIQVRIPERGLSLEAKLIDGSYPQWRAVLPETCGFRLVAESSVLANAARRLAKATAEPTRKHRTVKLDIGDEKVQLTMEKVGGEVRSSTTIPSTLVRLSDALEGPPPPVSFEAALFADCLDLMDGEIRLDRTDEQPQPGARGSSHLRHLLTCSRMPEFRMIVMSGPA